MATIIAQKVSNKPLGQTLTMRAAAANDRALPGTGVYLLVRNGSASAITVTLDVTNLAFNGTAIADTVVSVPATSDKLIPLLPNYGSAADGLVGIAYSATATVTVAVIDF